MRLSSGACGVRPTGAERERDGIKKKERVPGSGERVDEGTPSRWSHFWQTERWACVFHERKRKQWSTRMRGCRQKEKRAFVDVEYWTWNTPRKLISQDWSFFKTCPALLNTRRRAERSDDKDNTVAMETQTSSQSEKKTLSQFQICCEIYKLCQIMRINGIMHGSYSRHLKNKQREFKLVR